MMVTTTRLTEGGEREGKFKILEVVPRKQSYLIVPTLVYSDKFFILSVARY